jgi:hypothetical protein
MRLTFEKTRGTRTIYFPLERSSDFPADFVVVIRPACEHGFSDLDEFSAGVAFCNPADPFVKRKGRAIAFERLRSNAPGVVIHGSADEIIASIMEQMIRINKRRDANMTEQTDMMLGSYIPDMDEGQIERDLVQVMSYDALAAYFTKKEKHRVEQLALEV